MVYVDVCGSQFSFLAHSRWHGFTLADLVMPMFLFVSGGSFGLSSTVPVFQRMIRRSIFLLLVGFLVQGSWLPGVGKEVIGFDLVAFRIPGILQRIAMVNFLLYINGRVCGWESKFWIFIFPLFLVLLNILVMRFLVADGCDSRQWLDMSCNAAGLIDRKLFGSSHMFTQEYDPEGFLSTLPCLFISTVGFHFVRLLKATDESSRTTFLLHVLKCGVVSIGLGFFLSYVIGIHFNKALWSPSYNFLTSGVCLLIFAFLIAVQLETHFVTRVMIKPLIWFGSNSLLFFVISDSGGLFSALIGSVWVEGDLDRNLVSWFRKQVVSILGDKAETIVYTTCHLLILSALFKFLFDRRIFLKV